MAGLKFHAGGVNFWSHCACFSFIWHMKSTSYQYNVFVHRVFPNAENKMRRLLYSGCKSPVGSTFRPLPPISTNSIKKTKSSIQKLVCWSKPNVLQHTGYLFCRIVCSLGNHRLSRAAFLRCLWSGLSSSKTPQLRGSWIRVDVITA